jgi:phage tail-like protein
VRSVIDGLETPHPLGLAMPAIYQDDEFAMRWISAFDPVLAPVFCTLDNFDSYLDPQLAPDDFVSWLASWVGLVLDENWTTERQRQLVDEAAELYRWRGTARGLAAHIAVYTGIEPEVLDSGGYGWSPVPGGQPPGDESWTVTIRVHEADHIDPDRLERLIEAAKPAHIVHRVEVIPG